MTILKVKSILYSLTAIVMVTFFLCSCEKEPEVISETDNTTYSFKIPDGMTEGEANRWLEKLNEEDFRGLMSKYELDENKISSRGNCYWTDWKNATNYSCGVCSDNRVSKFTYQIRYFNCNGECALGERRNINMTCIIITC